MCIQNTIEPNFNSFLKYPGWLLIPGHLGKTEFLDVIEKIDNLQFITVFV